MRKRERERELAQNTTEERGPMQGKGKQNAEENPTAQVKMKVIGGEVWSKWCRQKREQVTFNSQMWAEVGEKERESKRKSGEQLPPNKSVRRRREMGVW